MRTKADAGGRAGKSRAGRRTWRLSTRPRRVFSGGPNACVSSCCTAGIAASTSKPAIFATSHISLNHPIVAAKQSTVIDHISGGRYALNIVTGWNQPEIDMFGNRSTRGKLLVTLVVNVHAAYRMQLFLYLKSCGREEMGTMNLWGGVDAPPPA